MLHTMHNSELRHYTLDRAGIMFVTDLIRDTLTSPTLRRNAIAPEMEVIATLTTLTNLATGKMQLCSSDDLGLSQPSISKVITQTITALSETYCVAVHFIELEREREREYCKTGKIIIRLIIDPTLKCALLFPSWTTNQSQSSKDCVIASNGVCPASSL